MLFTASVLAQRHAAGSIAARRVGVRHVDPGDPTDPPGALAPPSTLEFATLGPDRANAPPTRRIERLTVGSVELELEVERLGECAVLHARVKNGGAQPLRIEGVVLGFEWTGHGLEQLRFLRHGWQSWSYTGTRALDDAGAAPFPSGEWLRGMHHAVGAPGAEYAGWHESDTVIAVGASSAGPSCVVGAIETGRAFAVAYAQRAGDRVVIDVEQRLELTLAPGEERELESLYLAVGFEPEVLLERYAGRWGRDAGARTAAPFVAGWCSWYHFFHEVTESDLLRNLDALAASRDSIPIEVVQLDDGYQRAIGDWLEPDTARFPGGIAPLARAIRDAGFRAGLWTAPFCVVPQSELFRDHPDWLLRNGDEFFLPLLHGEWSPDHGGRVHALDPTRDEVRAHLRQLFGVLVEFGFDYLKLDFLHAAAMRADAHDPNATRAARLRLGLDAIREGAGERAFLLGCGCPLGPAVGVVDAMRIGPDVAPYWPVDASTAIPGIEAALPSLHSALRSVLHRGWMHRRLWINDPDCLMVRSTQTDLSRAEVRSLAAAIAVTGGSVVFSDDTPALDSASHALLRESIAAARAVDSRCLEAVPRLHGLLDEAAASAQDWSIDAALGADRLRAHFNLGDEAVPLRGLPGRSLFESHGDTAASDPRFARDLAPHGSEIAFEQGTRELAVFCDFDGTFSVQDVGSTIARRYLAERRAELWEGFQAGGLNAWQVNEAMFAGFALPEAELHDFLETVDLDPGARDLLSWCEHNKVPFRILSDGFDYNLEALMRIHDVSFAFTSNGLRYVDGEWHIRAGAADPHCGCGTGICKRAIIAEYRRAHPRACCVHIGNGRVSDLCGALEADLAFAKDSLAPALADRGAAFAPFDTLNDVVSALERWRAGAGL